MADTDLVERSRTGLVALTARALFMPWSFDRAAPISAWSVAVVTAVGVLGGAACSTLLSTWTYLVGKGLLVTVREMDMGMDDLPADTVAQVAASAAASFLLWTAILLLALAVAIVVADAIYRSDRTAFRIAVKRTGAMSVWFIVWALVILAANSLREHDVRHPAAAIRAYAQLNQHWFRGSSAFAPGPIEMEPLVGRGRTVWLAIAFPIVWALSLPRRGTAWSTKPALAMAAAVALSWIAWAAVWRLMPWLSIETFTG